MTSHWEMRVALAALDAEALAIAPLQGWGLVIPLGTGAASYQLRHRWGTAVNRLQVHTLPPALRTPIATARVATLGEGDGPFAIALRAIGVSTLAALPLPEGGGLFWAGLPAGQAFADPQIAALDAFAHRLAERSRVPESDASLADRYERLDVLAAALPLMSRALDLRDVFERLSEIAQRVLPHESSVVGINNEDRTEIRLHALSGDAARGGVPAVVPNPYPPTVVDTREFAIVRDLTTHPIEQHGVGARMGFRSGLRMPLWLDGEIKGMLDFSSRELNRYSEDDVPIARRIADYVTLALSHQELAAKAQRAATIAERAASLNTLDDLLSTLKGVLDVRDVFDRVSAIAQSVLPHDALSIPVIIAGTNRVKIYANTGFSDEPVEPFERPIPDGSLLTRPWEYEVIEDIRANKVFVLSRALNAGMLSALVVPIRLQGRLFGSVNFYSRTLGRFTTSDVPIARRVADHIALSLSHQQLAADLHQHEEVRAHAANL